MGCPLGALNEDCIDARVCSDEGEPGISIDRPTRPAKIERTEAFEAMRRALEPVIAELAAIGQNPVSLAAE